MLMLMRMIGIGTFRLAVSLTLLAGANVGGADLRVLDAAELRAAVASAKPGTRLLLAGGRYGAGFHFANIRGDAAHPIVIAAADPQNPPVFHDGNTGLHLSNPAYVELHDLVLQKMPRTWRLPL